MRTSRHFHLISPKPQVADTVGEAEAQPLKSRLHRVDHYEAPSKPYLEKAGVIDRTFNSLVMVRERAQVTVRFGGSNAILEKVTRAEQDFRHETRWTRKKLSDFRSRIYVLENEIGEMRREIFLVILQKCSKDTKANVRTLSLLKTLLDGDLNAALVMTGKPRAEDTVFAENEILFRLDPRMLKDCAQAGICEAMSTAVRRDLEDAYARRRRDLDSTVSQRHDNRSVKKFIDDLNELDVDEGRLNSQVMHKNVYYNLSDKYWPVLDRLCVFLDENGLSILSRSRMNRQILESLYREQLEVMCAFGVIEKLDLHEIDALVKEGGCQRKDFVHCGNNHYRIHNDGLNILKHFLRDDEIRVQPKKIVAGALGGSELHVELY